MISPTKKILFVESDREMRRRCCKFLEWEGFEVLAVDNEASARDILDNRSGEFDLVISSPSFWVSKSQASGGEKLQTRILLTSEGAPDQILQDHPFLMKPYYPEVLVTKVRKTIGMPETGV
jgi:DNA-binding NtrC family response regulator